jgi:hypothetical protein
MDGPAFCLIMEGNKMTYLIGFFLPLLLSLAMVWIGHKRKKEGLKNLGMLFSFTIGSLYMWGLIKWMGRI